MLVLRLAVPQILTVHPVGLRMSNQLSGKQLNSFVSFCLEAFVVAFRVCMCNIAIITCEKKAITSHFCITKCHIISKNCFVFIIAGCYVLQLLDSRIDTDKTLSHCSQKPDICRCWQLFWFCFLTRVKEVVFIKLN